MQKLIIPTLVFFLSSISVSAQSGKHDFTFSGGALFNEGVYQPDLGGMYRYGVLEGLYLKAGYSYHKNRTLLDSYPQLVYSSDSLSISRTQYTFSRNHTIRLGVDFEKVDFLVLGASLIGGYRTSNMELYDRGMVYNEELERWERNDEATYAYYDEEIPEEFKTEDNASLTNPQEIFYGKVVSTTNFILFGIELNAGIHVPIGDRLELTAQYTPQFIRYQQIDATQSFTPTEGEYKSEILSTTRLNQRIMAGLRVKI